jgi:two-component system nitrate/nitrite response regulator NarL
MRVLVADDHLLFRDGITTLLDAAGIEVVAQVADGRAAVDRTLHLHPDLVLMDISMPHMSGLEALRLIKDELPDVKVVMLTISERPEDISEAIEAGADGYLLKSLNPQEFIDMLDGLKRGEVAAIRSTFAQLTTKGFTEPPRLSS